MRCLTTSKRVLSRKYPPLCRSMVIELSCKHIQCNGDAHANDSSRKLTSVPFARCRSISTTSPNRQTWWMEPLANSRKVGLDKNANPIQPATASTPTTNPISDVCPSEFNATSPPLTASSIQRTLNASEKCFGTDRDRISSSTARGVPPPNERMIMAKPSNPKKTSTAVTALPEPDSSSPPSI